VPTLDQHIISVRLLHAVHALDTSLELHARRDSLSCCWTRSHVAICLFVTTFSGLSACIAMHWLGWDWEPDRAGEIRIIQALMGDG
jgi:hypothetical protein